MGRVFELMKKQIILQEKPHKLLKNSNMIHENTGFIEESEKPVLTG